MTPETTEKDKKPALFLDRDGVINTTADGYTNRAEDFKLIKSVPESIHILAGYFHPIVVVTNQAGVYYGQMSVGDLHSIHQKMHRLIAEGGGQIDKTYFCTEPTHTNALCRKPNPGMAYWAKADFPEIEFSNSWMVGDMKSDIEFGRRLGMKTVLIENEHLSVKHMMRTKADYYFERLIDFAKWYDE